MEVQDVAAHQQFEAIEAEMAGLIERLALGSPLAAEPAVSAIAYPGDLGTTARPVR